MEVDEKISGGWQSEDEEGIAGFGNMDPDQHYLQPRSGNGTSTTTASVGNASESSRKKESGCCSCCTWLLVTRIVDLLLLLVVSIVQGSLLNYLLVWHRQESHTVYLWFLVDFLVVISFVGALTSSYMRIARRLRTAFIKPPANKSRSRSGDRKAPVYGTLPLSYISWLVYGSALAARIVVVFHTDVANNLGHEGLFTPQRFKMVICVSSIVFLLLVHAHGVTVQQRLGPNGTGLRTDAAAAADRRRFVSALCATTAFEVFDAVAFLELLFPEESGVMLPYNYNLEAVILTLVTLHLLLPAASLYQLSLCDFGSRGQRPSARVGLIFSVVKLLAVEVPYLVIRAYLWDVYGASTSVIFLMKNVLMIFVKVRYLIPEYVAVMVEEKKVTAADAKKNFQLKSLS